MPWPRLCYWVSLCFEYVMSAVPSTVLIVHEYSFSPRVVAIIRSVLVNVCRLVRLLEKEISESPLFPWGNQWSLVSGMPFPGR